MKRKKSKKSTTRILRDENDELVRTYLFLVEDRCCTCGVNILEVGRYSPKTNPHGLQVGHYIGRGYITTRTDLRNVHLQCSGCNFKHQYNTTPYTLYLIGRYGVEIIKTLKDKSELRASEIPDFYYNENDKLKTLIAKHENRTTHDSQTLQDSHE